MINVMVGIGLYGAMLVVVFKSPTMMAKDRIEGVAERIVLPGTVHAAVHAAQWIRQCNARQPTSVAGAQCTVQCSSSWERSPPLTPVVVGASPA